jgi:predicted transposase YdaD
MIAPLLTDIKKSRAYRDIAEEVAQELTPKITQELTPKIAQELTPKIAQELTPKIAQNKAREIAKSLLQNNMNLEFIAEVTGLSKKEVRALSKRLAVRRN